MNNEYFEVDSTKPFSKSLIWQINRDFYDNKGINAWSENIVPHNMTSNSMVGKTYAELIVAFLKDLSRKGKTKETVYIIELGAGHGRLAFHVLKHLEKLELLSDIELPPYCFILSDIVEESLDFYQNHPQLQEYFEKGKLDVSYFDAVESEELILRHSKTKIQKSELKQPIIAIANYFFDSIPNDVFVLNQKNLIECSAALNSKENPKGIKPEDLLKSLELKYSYKDISQSYYKDQIINEVLEDYKNLLFNTYLFFPERGMKCITNIKNLSSEGLMLLSMDKGFHEIHDLENKPEPDVVTHGSFSIWVNYHALGAFCEKHGGKVMFPKLSTFHLDLGCLMFLSDAETYKQTEAAYQQSVNDYGPDDYNGIKKVAYANLATLSIVELIAFYRLSAYDSGFFINVLPRLKQVYKSITFNERKRLEQSIHQVWKMYFNINEELDLAYELGGIFYDLGFYQEAVNYFDSSINVFGQKADIYYNKLLCFYQLRQDLLFVKTLKEAKLKFPKNEMLLSLDKLDMNAI